MDEPTIDGPGLPTPPDPNDQASCYFCTRPATWLYFCPQFKFEDTDRGMGMVADFSVDPERWPACGSCADLVEAHDIAGLTDVTVRAAHRHTGTSEYDNSGPMVNAWYSMFDVHRMPDRMAFG